MFPEVVCFGQWEPGIASIPCSVDSAKFPYIVLEKH